MKRSKPLRGSPIRRKARRRKTTEAGRAYMLAVKRLPCCGLAPGAVTCIVNAWLPGEVHAHHAGRRGMGQKSSDLETIPLCRSHHADWHHARGPFRGMDQAARREWADARIAETQALIAGRVDTASGEAL